MNEYIATVVESKRIAENIHLLSFDTDDEIKVRCGQFLNISVGDGAHLLRRPIAVCKTSGSVVTICFQIKGDGTRKLSESKSGDKLSVLLPLGNGFYVPEEEKKVALIGGGVGIFPMISVINEYVGKREIYAYMGFRNKNAVCMIEDMEKSDYLTVVTDDGSYGEKKNAVQAFVEDLENYTPDVVLSCGPAPMLKALKQALEGRNIPCYVSLEERMGCGIGACLVCVCNRSDGKRARVCKDGPVFEIGEVEL